MKNVYFLGVTAGLSAMLLFNANSLSAQNPLSDPDNLGKWKLNETVSDEFQGTDIDKDKWYVVGEFEDGEPVYEDPDNPNRKVWIGRAPSQFSGRNYRIEEGVLKLETRWEPEFPFSEEPDKEGVTYENITTACLIGRKQFTYGYMEIKSRAADAEITSSFWATGQGAELDIFEMFGDHKQENKLWKDREYLFTIIDWESGTNERIHRESHDMGFRVADDFHVYGCEWSEEGLKFYVDGEMFTEVSAAELGDDWILTKSMKLWLDQETFTWNGIPDSKDELGTDGVVDFDIEYVRVWQKEKIEPNMPLLNPGFETGDKSSWDRSYGSSIVVEGESHTGKYAGHLNGKGAIEQAVAVKPNTTYNLTCWGKVAEAGHSAFLGVKMEGEPAITDSVNTTTYAQNSVSFTTRATDESVNIWCWNGDEEHKIYIDDFVLLEEGVEFVEATSVAVSPTTFDVEEGKIYKLNADVYPKNATLNAVYWESMDTTIAKVNGSGLVTGVAQGTVVIKVRTDGTDEIFGSSTATVTKELAVVVEEISLAPATLEMVEGDESTLAVTVLPENASNKGVTWESSNIAVATVDENGKVKAIAEGTVSVTVTSDDINALTAKCEITVTPLTGINSGVNQGLIVYPNPYNTGSITVLLPGSSDGLVSICDAKGRVVYTAQFINEAAINIDAEQISIKKGIYIIKVQNTKETFVQKLLVN